jgi:hypothetical protein
MISAIIKIMATNPPSIAMAGGILLTFAGNSDLGMKMFYTGALLQGLWLALRFGLLRK